MPRASNLNDLDKGKILAFQSHNLKIADIAKKLAEAENGRVRSRKVIANFLKDPENYGKNRSGGPRKKLSDKERRLIVRKASNSTISCATLAAMLNNKVHRQTVWNVLKKNPSICRQKLQTAPKLTEKHKADRLEFARKNMNLDCSTVIFSDEKKLSLDGPDGFNGYRRDLRKEQRIFSKRNFGGGSLMTWGAFSAEGVLEMQIASTKMNSTDYTNVLQCSLLLFLRQSQHPNTFQHDNAPIHRNKLTSEWLADKSITVMDWPACSPDLNPIENIWGILPRRVYCDNKQYNNINSLRNAVISEWEAIDDGIIKKLLGSMNCLRP